MKRNHIKTPIFVLAASSFFLYLSSCTTTPTPEKMRSRIMSSSPLTALSLLPKDKQGLVDWSEVVKLKVIDSFSFLDGGKEEDPIDYLAILWSSQVQPQDGPRKVTIPLTSPLPSDIPGLPDWQEVARRAAITPASTLKSDGPTSIPVIIKSKQGYMSNVLFPHSVHTYFLSCKNCHPEIFDQDSWGIKRITMDKIFKGEYCGRCHDKVAFPLRECNRCHMEQPM